MTERLYYRDSYLKEFEATVLSAERAGERAADSSADVPSERARGGAAEERWNVVLDRTAFYPTSGGQPHDLGTLGGARVLEVMEREDGVIVHVTDQRIETGAVRGAIDWARRFDHMQQHTGQHLLSATFIELFRFPTVSFHLGRDISTIDLEAPALSVEQLEAAERRANEIVFEDRPVGIRFGSAEEMARDGARKQVEREGTLRAIAIEGYDLQPCGGTHVARTGQIGAILLRRSEKAKKNWRVEFVCGERARAAARRDRELLVESARQLGCGTAELPGMVARAIEERQSSYRSRQRLLEELVSVEALTMLALRSEQERHGGTRTVARVYEEADADYLRLLATKLIAEPGVRVLFASRAGGQIVFAQSAELGGDLSGLLREIVAAAGGKGGGTKDFAQGTVPDGRGVDGMIEKARERLRD
ncbi:MAG: alanyl-tRNA editing protein [Candidatus Acidiferrales bacterium]